MRAILDGIPTVPCTDCRYCLNCPQGVRIPAALASLNILALYQDEYRAQENYDWKRVGWSRVLVHRLRRMRRRVPQHIGIVAELARAAALFE